MARIATNVPHRAAPLRVAHPDRVVFMAVLAACTLCMADALGFAVAPGTTLQGTMTCANIQAQSVGAVQTKESCAQGCINSYSYSPPFYTILAYTNGQAVGCYCGHDCSQLFNFSQYNPGYTVSTYLTTAEAAGVGDPHFQAWNGARFSYGDGAAFWGKDAALISTATTAINAHFDRHSGPDAFPHAGTWMMGYGVAHASGFKFELMLRHNTEYNVVADPSRGEGFTRATVPAGGLAALIGTAAINGEDRSGLLRSGETLELQEGLLVHFPASKHANDKGELDGPLVVINTPELAFTIYLESEDTMHLDFTVTLRVPQKPLAMHGVVGQSLNWAANQKPELEGLDSDYFLSDGLAGTAFTYSLFGKAHANAARRALLSSPKRDPSLPTTAGSILLEMVQVQ